MRHHDSFIVIVEGIDGSGKDSLCKSVQALLTDNINKWKRNGQSIDFVDIYNFPDYSGPCATAIRELMDRQLDEGLRRSLALLFALDRKIYNYGRDYSSRVKIFDRYYPSNFVYNYPELPLQELINLEKDSFVGDVVFILDIDPEESFKRRPKRRDKYEEDKILLQKARVNYLELAKKFGWVVLDGTEQTRYLTAEVLEHITRMNHGLTST